MKETPTRELDQVEMLVGEKPVSESRTIQDISQLIGVDNTPEFANRALLMMEQLRLEFIEVEDIRVATKYSAKRQYPSEEEIKEASARSFKNSSLSDRQEFTAEEMRAMANIYRNNSKTNE